MIRIQQPQMVEHAWAPISKALFNSQTPVYASLDEKPGDRHLEFAYCSDTLSVLRKVTAGNPSGLFLVFVLPYR